MAPTGGQEPPPDRRAAAGGHAASPAAMQDGEQRFQQQGRPAYNSGEHQAADWDGGGDWGSWKQPPAQGREQENWWDKKGDQKPMWTQEEWDEWLKANPAKADKWKGWGDDWDNKAKASSDGDHRAKGRDDWDGKAKDWGQANDGEKGQEQPPAPAKGAGPGAKGAGPAPSESRPKDPRAAAPEQRDGPPAASAQGGFDPWSKALDRHKDQPAVPAAKSQPGPWNDNEDPWSKAVDPWSKAVGASNASKPLTLSKPKEPPKETPQPSWGSMTRTVGPSYQRLDLLSARPSGALGGEEDCAAWSGIGQLKGIRAMRVPSLEFGAGGPRRRERRERGRDDGDGLPARGSSPGPAPARDEAAQP
ncbi:unnamed protein product, partial [Prorocentrum cordatum]